MKNLKIIPVVEIDFGEDQKRKTDPVIWVTASNGVTDQMWEILHNLALFEQSRPYEMNRPKGVSTQFWFRPNPGYTLEEVLSLVISGTYIAQVYENNLDAFWQKGWFRHYSEIGQVLNLNSLDKTFVNYEDRGFDRVEKFVVDEETFMTVLNAFLLDKVETLTNSIFRDDIIRVGPSKSDLTLSRIETARNAKMALATIDEKVYEALFIGTKAVNLARIETFIDLLESDHDRLENLIARAAVIRQRAKDAYHVFEQVLEIGNCLDLYSDWARLTSRFVTASQELQVLYLKFDQTYGSNIMKSIKILVPSISKK